MTTGDPILTALARMEERLVERFQDFRRELRLDLDGRFDAVHKRLDRLEQEYEMVKVGLSRLEADIGVLKTDVASLSRSIRRMEGEIVFVKEAIARIEVQLERERSSREDLRREVFVLRQRLGELEDRVEMLQKRLPRE